MMNLSFLRRRLVKAAPLLPMFTPGPEKLIKALRILKTLRTINQINEAIKTKTVPELAGRMWAGNIIKTAMRPATEFVKSEIVKAGNSENGRSWPKQILEKRMVKQMRIMYHEADRAGPHLDIHIGKLSLVVRIPKELQDKLKYNGSGELTGVSKESLVGLLKAKIDEGFFLPQNRNHTIRDAKMKWLKEEPGIFGYGAGSTRQPILEDKVEFLSVEGDTIRMYAPSLYKHGQVFLHLLGNPKKAPIVRWAKIVQEAPLNEDKLHLKGLKADEIEKFKSLVEPDSVTKKYDGASAFFQTDQNKTIMWSGRVSKETGRNLEYSHKVPEIFRIKNKIEVAGIGELLFRKKFDVFNPFQDREMSSAQIGGILNSDSVRPIDIEPDFRIYRIDRFGEERTTDLDFFTNRALAERFIKEPIMNLPEMSKVKKVQGVEGLVGVPKGKSINDAVKIKWVKDPQDWQLESMDLRFGEKGRIAGVVWFKSLESGKMFKMGAGQLGNDEFVKKIMHLPQDFIGKVYKVASKVGHEGRAAKLLEEHLDKGV